MLRGPSLALLSRDRILQVAGVPTPVGLVTLTYRTHLGDEGFEDPKVREAPRAQCGAARRSVDKSFREPKESSLLVENGISTSS